MEKVVKIDNERNIKVIIDDNNNHQKRKIVESFYADGFECAHYSLEQDDNYCFSASLDFDLTAEQTSRNLLFSLDVDHPLFFAFIQLLENDEEEIIIRDSKNSDNDLKYLSVKKDNDKVNLNFVDKVKNSSLVNKFTINYDSKLDYFTGKKSVRDNEIKKRLNVFFDEACGLLLEDSHQINFEEYALTKTIKERKKERLTS